MKISNLFQSNALAPAWSYSVPHTLWRLMFSDNELIIGENRDTEKKSVTFFCLNATDGTVVWKEKQFSEQWWIGLEGISGDRLFLHGFQKPDMPEHKGIICVDARTGSELWRNADSALLTTRSTYVYSYRDLFEWRVYYEIDETTGVFIREMDELPDGVDRNVTLEKTDFLFPQQLEPANERLWGLLPRIVQRNDANIRSAEYIETNNRVLINIYSIHPKPGENGQENLTNTLYIVEAASGKKLFSDVLNKETPYPVPDSFFVDHDTLYYIKERKTVVALSLKK